MRRNGWLLVRVAAGFVMAAMVSQVDAEKVPVDKVPKKVMAAVKDRFPGAKIRSVEKEIEDGKVVYDVEVTQEGRKYEMDIAEDGTVIDIEKEVAAKDLSEAVRAAVEAKYPKAKLKEIMEVNKVKDDKETPDHYEIIIVTAGNREMEITVSLDGKTIKGEKKEEKK
jgi:uncharacterized membrane protein YkoI